LQGFTLIELVIVLGIISGLAAMVVPRFNNSDNTVLAQAHRLARDLRHAQSMAMNQGRTLVFNVQSTTAYRVSYGGSTVINPATQQPYRVTLDNDATLSGTDTEFDSMGRPSLAGNLLAGNRVYTLSGNSRSAMVTLNPVTGFVSVSP
jgi:prepilin-type N-terminal cleavage/methylation domain-containing protein